MNTPEKIQSLNEKYIKLKSEMAKVIVGQNDVVEDLLITLFSRGHALLIGVPGLAKTLLINTLSQILDISYKRIQFTPDLMPSDILGSEILGQDRQFRFVKGPIFANIILADEINRTPPKTQSALLEAMQEKSVTIAGQTYKLDEPFFVLATQNPIEQEGTYPLPEAQLDRFMFNILFDYPSIEEEINIVKTTTNDSEVLLTPIMNGKEIIEYQKVIREIPVPDNIINKVVKTVASTRPNKADANKTAQNYLQWGAGPRASQNLIIAAKCRAALHGKYSPDFEDVQAIASQVLRHRMVKNYKAEAEGISIDDIVKDIFAAL
ncbi:MAG: AAA family ATPase [Bacteroidales bacterium]|jgi:MoxR-like ATPase|nr:AAA family ATPase [Bacteroidales bacterium]